MRTNVYIDGFNLYYGCLRGTPSRWLDIAQLAQQLVPRNDVRQVRYFTARIKREPTDPRKDMRQQTYLRAIETLPGVTIHYGTLVEKTAKMPLASSPPESPTFVRVVRREEKGSDVNLAAHLLMDGFREAYDVAVVISGDTDLEEPVRMVVRDLAKPVLVFNPYGGQSGLKAVATTFRSVPHNLITRSQLPNPVIDAQGRTIHCPAEWLPPS